MRPRSQPSNWQIAATRGPVVLVSTVGEASGARAAAAALACAASDPDRAALLVDFEQGRPPRPSLIATAGARELEVRLNSHLPGARIASRGQHCQLSTSPDPGGLDQIAAALPLARESVAVIHLPPSLVRAVLEEPRLQATAALLRADLADARALTALAVRDLVAQGLRVAVLKQPLGWLSSRAALHGAIPSGVESFPTRVRTRLLGSDDRDFLAATPSRESPQNRH